MNPGLVMLSTCMQGQTGPRRDYRGFGQLMASLSGFFEVTGWADRDPSMVYGAYTDFICQRFCAPALVAALDHRRRTGQGQHIDVAQFEAALQVLGPELVDHAVNGRVATRRGNRDPDCAPHGVYSCRPAGPGLAGERWIAIACQDDHQWAALVEAMGRPDWACEPGLRLVAGRQADADRLDTNLAIWTAGQDARSCSAGCSPGWPPARCARLAPSTTTPSSATSATSSVRHRDRRLVVRERGPRHPQRDRTGRQDAAPPRLVRGVPDPRSPRE